MQTDNFENSMDNVIAPARICFPVTPSDSGGLARVTKAIFVGTGGNINLRTVGSTDPVTFRNVPSGAILDLRVVSVLALGTTASDIVGLA